jgi:phosphohistidine phosphatase SixA
MAPATIVLIRHAEKRDDRYDPHLSAAGRRRAERLAAYIPETFGRPDLLFAAADKPGSRRPRETLEPLAEATGLAINGHVSDKDSDAFAEELLSNPSYAAKTVVVSWRHALPTLARALGAPSGLCPDPWPEAFYDLVLRFDYTPGGIARATAIETRFARI